MHVHRKHRKLLVPHSNVVAVSGIEGDGCSNSDDDLADMPNTNVSDPLHFNAMFTLSLAAKHTRGGQKVLSLATFRYTFG